MIWKKMMPTRIYFHSPNLSIFSSKLKEGYILFSKVIQLGLEHCFSLPFCGDHKAQRSLDAGIQQYQIQRFLVSTPFLVKILKLTKSKACQLRSQTANHEGKRQANTMISVKRYLKAKVSRRLEETGPNMSDSCDILNITRLTISPRYIPDIIFSKPCRKRTIALFHYSLTNKANRRNKVHKHLTI